MVKPKVNKNYSEKIKPLPLRICIPLCLIIKKQCCTFYHLTSLINSFITVD